MRVTESFPIWRILLQFSEVQTALVGQPLISGGFMRSTRSMTQCLLSGLGPTIPEVSV